MSQMMVSLEGLRKTKDVLIKFEDDMRMIPLDVKRHVGGLKEECREKLKKHEKEVEESWLKVIDFKKRIEKLTYELESVKRERTSRNEECSRVDDRSRVLQAEIERLYGELDSENQRHARKVEKMEALKHDYCDLEGAMEALLQCVMEFKNKVLDTTETGISGVAQCIKCVDEYLAV